MRTLFRKELRQVLPAQLFLTALVALAGWALLDPDEVLAPFHEDQGLLHAIVATICFAEGLVLAYGQFASERWQGTEEYLLHRSTGRAGAFRAKALAGLGSLAVLVVLPPTAFGVIHLTRDPYAGSASVLRLSLIALASTTAFAGYGAGALASNLGRSLLGRMGMALASSATVSLSVFVAVMPWASGPLSMTARFALVVGGWATALLWAARHAFTGKEGTPPLGLRVADLGLAAVTAAVSLPSLALAPYVALATAITRFESDAPAIIADESGELFIATPTNRDREGLWRENRQISSWGRVYDIVDLDGAPVPESRALHYTARPGNDGPWETVFEPADLRRPRIRAQEPVEPRHETAPPFGLTGAWVGRSVNGYSWRFDQSSGVHWVQRANFDLSRYPVVEREPAWRSLDETTPNSKVVLADLRANGPAVVLLSTDESRFLRVVASDDRGGAALVDAPLPDGDRFVGLGMLYRVRQARLGLSSARPGLVVGERGNYVWNGLDWWKWNESEELEGLGFATLAETEGLQRWTLEVEPDGGLGHHVALIDVVAGKSVVEFDTDARTTKQRLSELLATCSCLATPPLMAVRSWLLPARGSPSESGILIGTAEVDPLRGQRRTWIVVALLTLTAWLVRDLGRRLASRGTPTERRLLWCLLTAALGAPAYVLARVVESGRNRTRPSTTVGRQEQRQLVIRTA